MRQEPLLLPAAALACGILIGHFFYFRLVDLLPAAILAALTLACSLWFGSGIWIRRAAISSALALLGIAAQVSHRQDRFPRLNAADGETVLLSGCVTSPPVFSPDREQFTLNLNPKSAIRVTTRLRDGENLPLNYGQPVEIAAKIRSPRNFQNPDAFDYTAYLAAQHIYWTGFVASPEDIKIQPGHCGFEALAWLYQTRTWALDRIIRLFPGDQQTASLLQGTLIGETSGVERRWTNDFRITGTYHALVISGLHISVLAFTLLFILRLFRLRRMPALLVATVASWFYAFISGLNSPVVRAASGFTFFLIASYFFRKTRILNVLAAIGLIYLLYDPDQLFDPAFQLSFLSAAAIAAFAIPLMERTTEPLRISVRRFDQPGYDPKIDPPQAAQWRIELRLLAETLSIWTRLSIATSRTIVAKGTQVTAFVAEAVIVSACIQFGLALPIISYFHRIAFTGLTANILVVPLLLCVVPLGIATIFTNSHLLAFITGTLLKWAEAVAIFHGRFEPAWRMAAIPLSLAIAFALSLILLAWCIRQKRWISLTLTVSLALFAAICRQPWNPIVRPGMLEVTAIDVSQGDSLLLVFPNGQTMLVDAGGFPGMERMKRKPQIDIGEDVVSPYLWSRRIRHLDYAVLTHGHSDHMGGLASVLDNFHPPVLWIGAEPKTAEWEVIEKHAAQDRVQIRPLTRLSDTVSIGGATVRVLAPAPDYLPGDSPVNDDSLVLEVSFGRRRVLLTGDAELPVEEDLVASGLLHPVTLLKVGHHGSKTSSGEDFLNRLNPEFAIISDGYMNQFHHPHPTVLRRLSEHHAAVLRTDQRGLITFLTDGDKAEIETFR